MMLGESTTTMVEAYRDYEEREKGRRPDFTVALIALAHVGAKSLNLVIRPYVYEGEPAPRITRPAPIPPTTYKK